MARRIAVPLSAESDGKSAESGTAIRRDLIPKKVPLFFTQHISVKINDNTCLLNSLSRNSQLVTQVPTQIYYFLLILKHEHTFC